MSEVINPRVATRLHHTGLSHWIVANYVKGCPHRAPLVLYTAFTGGKGRLFLDFPSAKRHLLPGESHSLYWHPWTKLWSMHMTFVRTWLLTRSAGLKPNSRALLLMSVPNLPKAKQERRWQREGNEISHTVCMVHVVIRNVCVCWNAYAFRGVFAVHSTFCGLRGQSFSSVASGGSGRIWHWEVLMSRRHSITNELVQAEVLANIGKDARKQHFTSVCCSKTKRLGHNRLHFMEPSQAPGHYVVVHVNGSLLQFKADSGTDVPVIPPPPPPFRDVLAR